VPVTTTASTSVTAAGSAAATASAALADCAVITNRLVAASNQDFEYEAMNFPQTNGWASCHGRMTTVWLCGYEYVTAGRHKIGPRTPLRATRVLRPYTYLAFR
jgi:hypothetical protein